MASLLTQMRPANSEVYDRTYGQRVYDRKYNLYRHIKIPPVERLKDPKPPYFTMETYPVSEHVNTYITPHGTLEPDVKEQFARHYQWKPWTEMEYIDFFGKPHVPPRKPCIYNPHCNVMNVAYPGRADPKGPYEWQEYAARRYKGQLPENKSWPTVGPQYVPFPYDGYPRRDLYRCVRPRQPFNRSVEETQAVQDHIRSLVKNNAISRPFARQTVNYAGFHGVPDPRHDGLEKPRDRNPQCMTSNYMAQYSRHMPSKEYQRPQHGFAWPLSNALVLQHPYSYFSTKPIYPSHLDHKPWPWTFTDLPCDNKLITDRWVPTKPRVD